MAYSLDEALKEIYGEEITKKKKWYQEFLQKPKAFDDGYQFGDITKTVAGTAADVVTNIIQAPIELGANIAKLGAHAVADITNNDRLREKIATRENPLLAATNKFENKINNYSVAGNTTDTVANSIGQSLTLASAGSVLGKAANIPVGKLNMPTLSVISGAGSGIDEAKKKGGSGVDAWSKAIGSGLIEGFSEGMFGMFGVGGNELTDQMAKSVANKFSSGAAKVLAKTGVQASGEAFEEFMSYALNQGLDKIIDDVTGNPKYYEKWDWGNVGEQMAVAYISAGLSQGANTMVNIDSEYKKAINEQQKKLGRTLTEQERQLIRNTITNNVTTENETDSSKQFITNENGILVQNPNYTQTTQNTDVDLTSINSEIEALREKRYKTTNEKQIAEIDAKINKLQAQLNKTNALLEQQQVANMNLLQSANYYGVDQNISSEVLQNIQNFLDRRTVAGRFDASIEEDALWLKDKNGNRFVLFNPKAEPGTIIQELAIHEMTHDIMSSPNSRAVINKDEVINYLRSFNDYEEARADLTEKYKKKYGTDNPNIESLVDEEALAFTLAKRLGNQEYINQLVKSKPSIAKQIYTWIVDKLNSFINNGKVRNERLFWENVKNRFEKAYQMEYNNVSNEADTRFAVSMQRDDFTKALSKEEWYDFYQKIDKHGIEQKQPGSKNITLVNDKIIYSIHDGEKPNIYDIYIPTDENNILQKFGVNSEDIINDIYDIAQKEDINEGKVQEIIQDYFEKGLLGRYESGNNVFVSKNGYTRANIESNNRNSGNNSRGRKNLPKANKTNQGLTNSPFNMSTKDNKGNALSKEQQEYFKDSKVRDENGNLEVVYHQTKNDFTEFKNGFSVRGFKNANFFTNQKPKQILKNMLEGYVKIDNPLYLENTSIQQNIVDDAIENGYDGIINQNVQGIKGKNEIVTFNSNQFKNIDNTNPTTNADIRFAEESKKFNDFIDKNISKDNQGNEVKPGMQKYMVNSRARVDEDINKPLVVVYHTTTDKIPQFNEFNPVGTDYYKFGDQVVNYFTDDKNMSGSYADQHYKMADTKKLISLKDVNKFLKEYSDSFNTSENPSGNADYVVKEENGKYNVYNNVEQDIINSAKNFINTLNENEKEFIKKYLQDGASKTLFEDRYGLTSEQENYIKKYENWAFNQYFPKSLSHAPQNYLAMLLMNTYTNRPVATYDNKEQLFRNIKTDLEIDNYDKRSKLQYEGYVNITNPYIIDAEGRTWNKVESKADSDITKELLKVNNEDRQYLERLASDSIKTYNDNLFNYQQAERAINDFAVDRTNTTLEQRLIHRTIHDLGFEDFMKVLNNDKNVYWGRKEQFMDDAFNNGFATLKQKEEYRNTGNIPEEVLNKVNKLIHEPAKYEDRFVKKELEVMGMKPDVKETTIYDLWNNQDKAYKTFDEGGRYEYSKFNNQVNEKNLYRAIDNEILFKVAKKGFNDDNIRLLYNDWSVTNDIVKSIIELNKVGENYDGIIMKNVVDYGGDSEEHTPHNLYITFASNQFKALDNENPTEDADIRYSVEDKKFKEFIDKNIKGEGTKTPMGKLPKAPEPKLPNAKESAKDIVKQPIERNNLPLARIQDVLKVAAEDISKQINEKGDFDTKQRRWVKTSTESDILKDKVYIEDLDPTKLNYVVQSNKKSVDKANAHIKNFGYEKSLEDVRTLMRSDKLPSASDVALLQRMIQEATKKGDYETAQELIMDTAIVGTDLGQATQALSIIKKLTPEGQLKMYTKLVQRAKARGENSFRDVEITPQMVQNVLEAYNEDGTYNQDDLNRRVEEFKQDIANQMKTSAMEKIDAWRYLSMLGNPKTHIRNIVSNVAMRGTIKVKNAVARTLETILPVKERTKTWKKASSEIKNYANQTAEEMKGIITGETKYNEKTALETKKQIFKNKFLERLSNFNSNALEWEDWLFSKKAFKETLQEYLTANGINTLEDVENNPELIEKAKNYAVEQAEIATFRQYSKLASTINQLEKKNKVASFAVKALVPFKKTPINVAKTGVKYSPLGLIKNLSYDVYQLKQGNINASQFVDNLSQGLTGTTLTLIGYALAKAGILKGSGGNDKDDKYDTQLGDTGYSLKIGGNSYSLSWLSPVAMPLFVGANAYEQLEEEKDWDMNVVSDTLAKTLDPLNEMSFVQGLTNALQSYGSGVDKVKGSLESTVQNYVGQFFPTLLSQFAATIDDKKRSTKASNDSKYKFGEQTVRSVMYKLPGIRQNLEVATDIWGNEKEQSNNIIQRAFENFIAPYSRNKDITTDLDRELKRLYGATGETGVIPSIPYAYVKYNNETYRMSANEYTEYKKTYGQTANKLLNKTIKSSNYKSLSDEEKVKVLENIFGYSKYVANQEYFKNTDISYSNKEYTKADLYSKVGNVSDYYLSKAKTFNADKDANGKTISGSAKKKVVNYINSLNTSIPEKAMLIKLYGSYTFNDYDKQIVNYINSKNLTQKEKEEILTQLGFTVRDGRVY